MSGTTPAAYVLCLTCGHALAGHQGGTGRCHILTGAFGTGPSCTCTKASR
jgi:hypothetical protein